MVSKGYKRPQKANPAEPPAINVANNDACNVINAELNVSKAETGIEGTVCTCLPGLESTLLVVYVKLLGGMS